MSQSPDNEISRDGKKLRVLVVDDEPTLRLGFAYALSNRTTIVETAATGREALERIAAAEFDIVILDLRMPEIDGLGVIEMLRSQRNILAIVLCTAALSPHATLRAIRLGVVDFLLKPVRPVDLRQVIEYVLRPGRAPQALHAVRNGNRGEAIRILSSQDTADRQSACWLSVLNLIENAEVSEEVSSRLGEEELAEKVRGDLSLLAFNATPIP